MGQSIYSQQFLAGTPFLVYGSGKASHDFLQLCHRIVPKTGIPQKIASSRKHAQNYYTLMDEQLCPMHYVLFPSGPPVLTVVVLVDQHLIVKVYLKPPREVVSKVQCERGTLHKRIRTIGIPMVHLQSFSSEIAHP